MKLDAAAHPSRTPRSTSFIAMLSMMALMALMVCLIPAGAMALDGIDLNEPPEATAVGECPRLIQIKYPFLSCVNGEITMAEGNDSWENSRRLPLQSRFIEGDGYWGPDLNSD